MHIAFLSAFGFCTSVFAQSGLVDSYIARESHIAHSGVLANTGSKGSRSAGAKPGVVIASPSNRDPDYLFTWTRDSSLVFKGIVDRYTRDGDNSLRSLIDDFVAAQATLQRIPNRSGNISTGGVGEPKFKISLTEFDDDWGRPQRDGPALRSTTLIQYANWLVTHSNSSHVVHTIWPVIKLDLDYVANNWNRSGYDLWEETVSPSFFTSAVQHRALREGSTLAQKIGQQGVADSWNAQASNILCFLQSYWNPKDSYITANSLSDRSGKDANTVLASIHTFDAGAGCDAATFQPCSDKALANLKAYVDSFRSIYHINTGIPANAPIATGRYPEDSYFGGNPWYITTAAVAEQLYDAIIVWDVQRSLTVSQISLGFFRQFEPSVVPGIYQSSSKTYSKLIGAVRTFADGFLAINANYTPPDGSLAEQFGRDDGRPLSAVHLTWSYASALSAFEARKGTRSVGWGAKGLKIPATCKSNVGPMVSATFSVVATTVPGENIYLVGSVDQLKNWSPKNSILLSSARYPTWRVTLDVPACTTIEYKYIRMYSDLSPVWESDPNHSITTPLTGSVVINSSWR